MKNIKLFFAFMVLSFCSSVFADGLLMPSNEKYPKDFLRNRVTEVTVNITGNVAETIVYQEFENEWDDSTDAVYSFPLPQNARATQILYWYNDKVYEAVLKVREQSPNPGTGEGGVAAEVNKYIGKNGIKIELKGIRAGMIQKIELHYLSQCDYYKGKHFYNYPLSTGQFVTHPVDLLQFKINVKSKTDINGHSISPFTESKILQSDARELKLELVKSKAYINSDLDFYYETSNSELNVDFFSVANDTMDGHFALFVKPQDEAAPDSVVAKQLLFLLSNSGSMSGNKFTQSVYAISQAIDALDADDYFNIMVFNYTFLSWKNMPVPATSVNKAGAKQFLDGVTLSYGSDLNAALASALSQVTDNQRNSAIIVFTDGLSILHPRQIENLNTHKTGIFPIAIGDGINRERLEMTAALNYGFVTYLDPLDDLSERMGRVINQLSNPVLKNVAFEFGSAGVTQIIPQKLPSTYAGSLFFLTGRYKNPGESTLSIAGTTNSGFNAYDFRLNFSDKKDKNKFVETLWAKETIDALEREIEVYGETPELKQRTIELSLAYKIRCRYTAYIADYFTEPTTTIDITPPEDLFIPESYISGNYPNPFNPETKIRFFLNDNSEGIFKFIRIYNLLGQLIAIIDVSNLKKGWNEITFSGKDYFGSDLPSGVYIVQLQVGNRIMNSIKINLLK